MTVDGRRHPRGARQLVLDLARDPDFGREDFLVAPSNAAALSFIDLWPDWPGRTLVLAGPAGSGKSHLAAIWARRSRALTVRCHDPIVADELARHPALVIEDCDRRLEHDRRCSPGDPDERGAHPLETRAEAALFHMINLVRDSGGTLVLTARGRPDAWGVQTADLLSRLRLSPVVEIGHPDAALVSAVLIKLFNDRQIRIDADIVSYAALHLDQSLEAVRRFVETIDEASLAESRRITKPLVAATIERMRTDEA